ncbi:DUF4156 domain-containing protein [Gilvimarinus agarilyticus]|uniref:DUF4156 domain-containing protein n=1 Tax=Gilvimarinus agarilyticus TaxID=679259 RepID=UPI0005A2565B|nr:DUF4156 domain-containing protein [Gilvimarinus agarilyticus]
MKNSLLLASVCLMASCSWVELEEDARQVTLAAPQDITQCKQISHVTASVMDGMGPFTRSEGKMSEELATMARNEAAQLGGDTVVPSSSIVDGRQHFTVYRCQ